MQVDIPLCPILRPSWAQFKNFQNYVERVEKQYRGQYGMVKIVPPPQWKSKAKNYKNILDTLEIQQPQYQTLHGQPKNYYFMCKNQKAGEITLDQFKQIAAEKQKQIKNLKNKELIERKFWNILRTLNKQIYCANVEVTLMDQTSGEWELEKLKSFFSTAVTEKIIGLNTSFLFIGAWRSFFNWHIEDLDLSAINVLHEGAPKVWYAIHPSDRKRFETIMSILFPEENLKCSNFLRHKQIFTDPYLLKREYPSLRISKMYQNEGEISLAFAQGYHSGFNMGFNIAEAVNYGTRDWLERYSCFKGCRCPAKIGVELDHKEMVENLQKDLNFNKIKDLPAFKKIQQKGLKESQFDLLLEQANSEQIDQQIEKEKRKPINKGKKKIFVPKFNRYFPAERPTWLQCDHCHKWKKVNKTIADKFKNKKVSCQRLGFTCRKTALKSKEQAKVFSAAKKLIQKPLIRTSNRIKAKKMIAE